MSQEEIYRGKSSEALSSVVYSVACVAKVRSAAREAPLLCNTPAACPCSGDCCSGVSLFNGKGKDQDF